MIAKITKNVLQMVQKKLKDALEIILRIFRNDLKNPLFEPT
jgi:hypothetical protein